MIARLLAAFLVSCLPRSASAWLFEEHADIGRAALIHLAAEERVALSTAWQTALSDPALARLCLTPWQRGVGPRDSEDACIDFGMLAALAGDHSCSVEDLRATLASTWVDEVLRVAARTAEASAEADSHAGKLDAWSQTHLDLQWADPDYLDRADDNSAHFLEARKPSSRTLEDFLRQVTGPDAQTQAPPRINAIASYITYHGVALQAASKLGQATGANRSALARRALLAEAMALHFLEDAFSAGHVVGSTGNSAERKGTHDYYCEHPHEVRTWNGQGSFSANGDGFMVEGDRERAAFVVAASLRDLIDALRGRRAGALPATSNLERLDVCKQTKLTPAMSQQLMPWAQDGEIRRILRATPVPALEGALPPRFSSEVGVFLRVTGGAGANAALGGYSPYAFDRETGRLLPTPHPVRFGGLLQFGVGVGFAVDGVTTRYDDGLLYLQGTALAHSDEVGFGEGLSVKTEIDRRLAFGAQVRSPFAIIPGDAIIALILSLVWDGPPMEYLSLAASGGPGGWQRVHPLGSHFSWQITLGREVGIYRAGRSRALATYAQTVDENGGTHTPAQEVTAWEFDVPVLELRFQQLYSGDLGGGLTIKLGGLFDRYENARGPDPRVGWSYGTLLKVAFEGRKYVWRP